MEKITELLNSLEDLGKYIPKLDTLMGWVQWLISLAVRVGPICILALGIIYLLIPPKEANHKAGYRTYFGMGSVMAWRFTQLVAGILMTLTGLILTLIAYSTVKKLATMDLMTMAETALNTIKVQVICALVIYVFMFLLTAIMFDRKGNRRFAGRENSLLDKLAPKEKPVEVPAEEEEEYPPQEQEEYPQEDDPQEEAAPVVQYERQGEQVITADDIVIEGLD